MTREQVRFVPLGTPLVTDVFHADRWDYIYRFQPGKGEVQERRLSVIFVYMASWHAWTATCAEEAPPKSR